MIESNLKYAPIVVFAFNRLNSLKATIESLLENEEASLSDLFVFVDGPRKMVDGETEKVEQVRRYVESITGFHSLHYKFSEQNKGLANSVISGTTELFESFDRLIVVEDDLFVSHSFLRFMNTMLDRFADDERIMQVSGYGCKLNKSVIREYPYDVYINERAHSWSWATWKDRWMSVDWTVADFEDLSKSKTFIKRFNKRGSDLYGMLKGYINGKNQSWYIRFNYSMHKQGRYSVMPIKSLVKNDGFGNDATNCSGYNRYKVDFEIQHTGDFKVPDNLLPNEKIIRNSVRYWSLAYRAYGKFMTLINNLFYDIAG